MGQAELEIGIADIQRISMPAELAKNLWEIAKARHTEGRPAIHKTFQIATVDGKTRISATDTHRLLVCDLDTEIKTQDGVYDVVVPPYGTGVTKYVGVMHTELSPVVVGKQLDRLYEEPVGFLDMRHEMLKLNSNTICINCRYLPVFECRMEIHRASDGGAKALQFSGETHYGNIRYIVMPMNEDAKR